MHEEDSSEATAATVQITVTRRLGIKPSARRSRSEVFRCTVLHCTLSRGSCAERWVRAEACSKATNGDWKPRPWWKFAVTCRGCAVGAEHAERCEVKQPKIIEWNYGQSNERVKGAFGSE